MMTRDQKGKFLPGHEKIGGRKQKSHEERILTLFKNAVTDGDIIDIIDRAVKDAKRGDSTARKFIFDYLVGPPVERKEITGADGKDFTIIFKERTIGD